MWSVTTTSSGRLDAFDLRRRYTTYCTTAHHVSNIAMRCDSSHRSKTTATLLHYSVAFVCRHVVVCRLSSVCKLLETWFELGVTCVKWGSYFSDCVKLSCGIRQGGVLSPYLFAVFIDSIVDKIKVSGLGCYIRHICFIVLLYADDIILLAPSVSALQKLYQFVNQNCSGWIWLLI